MKIALNTKHRGLIGLLLLATLLSINGCVTGSRYDPLEGWKDLGSAYVLKGCPFDNAITDDYQDYIRSLPEDEKNSVMTYRIHFYEGIKGQRAVRVTTLGLGIIGGITWDHILIYNPSDKRIKTMKHKVGRFLS